MEQVYHMGSQSDTHAAGQTEKKFRHYFITENFKASNEDIWYENSQKMTQFIKTEFELDKLQYGVIGIEDGDRNEVRHYHATLYFKSPRSWKKMKKLFPRANIEKALGTCQQGADYCKKDGNWDEFGEIPQQGKRSDIDEIRDVVNETQSMKEVVMVAKSYQAIKVAEAILKYTEKPRNWKPEVFWFFGATGTGKSKLAYEMLGEDCYTCLSTGRWFDGYDAHENVLIDDMRKDFMKFHELLRLLDRYAMRIETKGGTRQFVARRIIITSAFHPRTMFETREDINQLLRRIDEVRVFE